MSSSTRRTIFVTLLILSCNRPHLSLSTLSTSSSSSSSSSLPSSWFVAGEDSVSVSPLVSPESESVILSDGPSSSGSLSPSHPGSPYASAQTSSVSLPRFHILAVIPNEKAVLLSRELRSAVARWQTLQRERSTQHNSGSSGGPSFPGFSVSGIGTTNLSADDTSLIISPIPAGNDTERLLESMCQSFEMHNPSLILTLLEPRRTYYLKMIAKKVDVPILSLSSEYRESFQLFQSRRPSIHEETAGQVSLDPPISSLADAAFELLWMQHWFDAILLIDDTAASDLFSYRLNRLCRNNRSKKSTNSQQFDNNFYFLDSVWNRLEVIQLSKNLLQNEFYLKMSEIQTSHRRIILVHCDKVTTKRIMDIASVLGLLRGHKIWVLLDGVIGSELVKPKFWSYLNLPTGIIALRQRAPTLTQSDTLLAITSIIGEAATYALADAKSWIGENDFRNGSAPEVSCWHNAYGVRIKYSQVIYRELRKVLKPINNFRLDPYRCKTRRYGEHGSGFSVNEMDNLTTSNQHHQQPHLQPSHQQQHQQQQQQQQPDNINSINNNYYNQRSSIWPYPIFDILNLIDSDSEPGEKEWKVVGNITRANSTLNAIRYINGPSSDLTAGPTEPTKHNFRIVTGIAPPFVHLSTKLDNGTCLTGVACLRVNTSRPDELVYIFTDFNSDVRFLEGKSYTVVCCSGIAIDLLNTVARDLNFDYNLYLVADGLFGIPRNGGQWDGITADLVSGAAHITFSAFSVTSARVNVIDYSVPFFYSGVSCLARSQFSDVPLSAFLIPFSYQLWFAIFASLHATAIAAAIYEWLSPFGLNPWGRQRTKNFSLASALWVMYSLLFSHLVAFKAPKSWPNKVLINLWGCFSVIFLATYTANIAAHFAGLFSNEEINDFHDGTLMSMRTGVARSSASEGYIKKENMILYEHVQKFMFKDFDEGLDRLRNESLQVLIGDTAILDYFRANEPGCNLKLLGDSIFDDAYAVGMQKGFPLKNAISDLILRYNTYGYLDQLQRKWYGRVPCLENSLNNLNIPKPLSVRAVAGVFIMLLCGLGVGIFILMVEHVVFKYALPKLRKMPKDTYWKSPNLMFFSQKLYRFINTVELVSPHHSAKEIMSSLRTGQITSLFQKSLKRKAKEEARRRKSKSQFFEMMQEVRKMVQDQKDEQRIGIVTNQPILMTSPPLSLPVVNQDSFLSENDSIGGATTIRTSSIRWKEPSFTTEDEPAYLHQPVLKTPRTKPPSSLKSSDSRNNTLTNRLGKTKGSTSLSSTELCPPPYGLGYYRSPSSASSIGSEGGRQASWCATQIINMRENVSISLEDIALPGDSGCGLGGNNRRKYFGLNEMNLIKTWSFDDLSILKQQLSYPANSPIEQDKMTLLYSQSPRASMIIQSPRHTSMVDSVKIQSMSKEDIISLWRSSERELLNNLQDALQQKKALEERLAVLTRILMKPP
ncbi:uncharacterized protein LOC128390693 isoform X2 [Panonychus citri]|uniref:uncharacterized protein LOC128390693 isoform X2 n=1 Tax=Panonychus citri TaxID=50023 RepID=UPI002307E4AB|nr:uncharacterized protein LOC128390693 isoform X2 [Panonychus citri]